jgi:hypothetical protein
VWRARGVWRTASLAALGLWYAVGGAVVFPYEISFFSELVGGPSKGYLYLADSNLDWGQLAHARQAYLAAHPKVLGEPPSTGMHPAAGEYLVGASYLQGLGITDVTAYEWFRHREPLQVLHYGLLLYDVAPVELAWIAQCTVPRVPLNEEEILLGTGTGDLRMVTLDCTETWIYPAGGRSTGIYALHLDLMEGKRACIPVLGPCTWAPNDAVLAAHLSAARLSYEQPRTEETPPSVLYEWTAQTVRSAASVPVYVSRPGTVPGNWSADDRVDGAVSIGGKLTLLDVASHGQGDGLVVETWWRVDDGPIPRAFSIMGQLLSAQGDVVGMYDGLGVSPLALLPGDVLVQRHRFDASAADGALWLRTGAYWLDSMERWTVDGTSGVDQLLVPLVLED